MILKIIKDKLKYVHNGIKYLSIKVDIKLFGDKEFVIISNNCWGAEIYKRLKKEYNTPFIGLFIHGPDYMKLLEKFDHYMSLTLQFTSNSKWFPLAVKYPIGKLDDIEIHFVHYKTDDEAACKWTKRLFRMNKSQDKNKYYFKICERDLTTLDLIQRFHTLPFKNKISFGVNSINSKDHITIFNEINNNCVPDGVMLYKISYKYIDLLRWIKNGKISNNWYSKIKYAANIV